MRDFLIEEGAEKVPFVGSVKENDKPEHIAEAMRETIGISADWANGKKVGPMRSSIEIGLLGRHLKHHKGNKPKYHTF